MILADDIVQSKFLPAMLGAKRFGWVTKAISDSQKFIFDPAASMAVTDLSYGRAQSLVDAIDFARCPFENTWIELDVRHLNERFDGEYKDGLTPVDKHGYLFSCSPVGAWGRVTELRQRPDPQT